MLQAPLCGTSKKTFRRMTARRSVRLRCVRSCCGLHIREGFAGGGVGGDAEDAESIVEVMIGLHPLCAGGDLPRDLLDLAPREVRGALGDALLKSSGGHG